MACITIILQSALTMFKSCFGCKEKWYLWILGGKDLCKLSDNWDTNLAQHRILYWLQGPGSAGLQHSESSTDCKDQAQLVCSILNPLLTARTRLSWFAAFWILYWLQGPGSAGLQHSESSTDCKDQAQLVCSIQNPLLTARTRLSWFAAFRILYWLQGPGSAGLQHSESSTDCKDQAQLVCSIQNPLLTARTRLSWFAAFWILYWLQGPGSAGLQHSEATHSWRRSQKKRGRKDQRKKSLSDIIIILLVEWPLSCNERKGVSFSILPSLTLTTYAWQCPNSFICYTMAWVNGRFCA